MAGAWGGAVQFLVIAVGGTVFAVVATHDAGGLASLWEKNSPAQTSLLLSSHHDLLPWVGMIAFALTIGFWNSAVSPLDGATLPGGAKRMGRPPGRDRGRLAAVDLAGSIYPAGPGGGGETRPAGQQRPLAAEASGLRLIEVLFGRQNPLGAAGQGLVVAAILAAVMNTVAAAVHAVSTLWTMDICQGLLRRNDSESDLIARGRRSSLTTIILATLLAPLLLAWDQGVFNYVLEVSAIIGPPAVVVFLVAFFWPSAHGRSAVATLVSGCLVGAALWFIVAQRRRSCRSGSSRS